MKGLNGDKFTRFTHASSFEVNNKENGGENGGQGV
jgi:hypothetical protein